MLYGLKRLRAFRRVSIITLSAALLFFLRIALAAEESSLDFQVPVPQEAEAVGKEKMAVLGRDVQCAYYLSQQSQDDAEKYYQEALQKEGFQNTLNEDVVIPDTLKEAIPSTLNVTIPKGEVRKLRFKRQDLVVDVILTNKPGGTGIAIGKYLQPEGAPDIEKTPLPLKKPFFRALDEDTPGEDIDAVPRPPEGVRWSTSGKGNKRLITYASPLSVNELREFYQNQMYYKGWEMEKEVSTAGALDTYKAASGTKGPLLPPSPFVDGENLEEIVSQSYILNFTKGREERAKVTISPNFMDKKLGAIVNIFYEQSG